MGQTLKTLFAEKMKIRNIFTSSWSSRSRRLTCADSVSFDDLGGDLPSERFPQLKESSLNHSFDASPVHHQSVTRFIFVFKLLILTGSLF